MMTLVIFKSNARGMQYGMGSYLRELTNALLQYSNVKIIQVHYNNSSFREFSIERKSVNHTEINIPASIWKLSTGLSYDEKYSASVINMLSTVIPTEENVVFIVNYITEYQIIKRIREIYSYPIISVVHSAQWQLFFNGNRKRFEAIGTDALVEKPEINFLQEKEIYQISDIIISVTNYMKTFITDEYKVNPSKIKVIPNGLKAPDQKKLTKVQRVALKHSLGFRSDESIILFSGRVDPSKGIYFLIESFIKACKISDNLRLVIVGQGNFVDCLNKYGEFYGRITYTGFLKQEDLFKFYQVADIGIVPSFYEQCPYTVLEMMAFGIPLIMSEIEGLSEILNNNECIFLTPLINEEGDIEFDTDDMAYAVIKLLGNKILRKSLSKSYIDLVNTRFTAKRMAENILEVLEGLKN
ncbi:MAG: glycosyltransferase [Bacteroidales bacterium]|nr:glycosyltransferase [Bacteroidales bacterium]